MMTFQNRMGSWLLAEYEKRKGKNSLYSQNAFARDLGLSPGRLSEILSGKRCATKDNVERIASHMGLSPNDKAHITYCMRADQLSRHLRRNLPTTPMETEPHPEKIEMQNNDPLSLKQVVRVNVGTLNERANTLREFMGLLETMLTVQVPGSSEEFTECEVKLQLVAPEMKRMAS